MGVLAAVKKNKVGAVVISVFDWYRKFDGSKKIYADERADIRLQRLIIQQKRKSFSESLTWPSWCSVA
jgi:hypothetical protein